MKKAMNKVLPYLFEYGFYGSFGDFEFSYHLYPSIGVMIDADRNEIDIKISLVFFTFEYFYINMKRRK